MLNTIFKYKIYSSVFILLLIVLSARIPLGTFNDVSAIDSVAHFVLPATGTPLLYFILEQSRLLPAMKNRSRLIVMFLLGVTLAVLWEIFELSVDLIFDTNWQRSNADTMSDLILGAFGTLLGSALFIKVYNK